MQKLYHLCLILISLTQTVSPFPLVCMCVFSIYFALHYNSSHWTGRRLSNSQEFLPLLLKDIIHPKC